MSIAEMRMGAISAGGQVSPVERAARFGNSAAVLAVDDHESAQILERELFDRGAAVVVAESPTPEALALAAAAGFIVIVAGPAPENSIDLHRFSSEESIRILESRGVLSREGSPPFIAEGI